MVIDKDEEKGATAGIEKRRLFLLRTNYLVCLVEKEK